MNILFLTPYPLKESPSQRFRFEQYFEILQNAGHSIRVQSFLTQYNWRQFSKPGQLTSVIFALLGGLARRLLVLPTLYQYHVVFIHREVTPVGPPVLEWLIAKVFNKRIIYDFDDALWLTDKKYESFFLRTIKCRWKVRTICRMSHRVSCGNDFLCQYARQFNNNVIYNPTTIDTDFLHDPGRVPLRRSEKIIIGWTGSSSTLKYLKEIEGILTDVEISYPQVQFKIIADQEPLLQLQRLTFTKWNNETEIVDLGEFDIGIMPLPDDDWSKGKCAFKALQYMALEIPTVASAVGVNVSVINHGVNGFLVESIEDWKNCLGKLILHENLREELGRKGRQTVVDNYSVRSNASRFLALFI